MRRRNRARSAAILIVKVLGLTVLLFVIAGIGARFVPPIEGAPPPSGSFMALLSGLFFLQTVAIAYPVARSRWSGWRLAATAFLIYFGPVTFLSQMETFLYLGDKLSPEMQRGIWLMGTFNAAVFAPVAVWVLGGFRRKESEAEGARGPSFTVAQWVSRIAALAALFVALYYLFGYFVAWQMPAVREYYGGTDPGSFLAQIRSVIAATPWMPVLQFVRGAIFVLIAIPVIRMMKGAWWEAGLALALLFSMPVLYLLLPNPLMPEAVTRAHLVETLPYQFLFGWIVAWVLRQPAAKSVPAEASARGRAEAVGVAR